MKTICPDCRGLCGKANPEVTVFTPCKTCGGDGRVPQVMYFGCIEDKGHYLKSKTNPNIRYHETAWGNQLDGGLFPKGCLGYADGLVHVTTKDGWTGIAIADNSVDSRPGSHSTFVTAHDVTGERLLELAKTQWPEVFGRRGFPSPLRIVQDKPQTPTSPNPHPTDKTSVAGQQGGKGGQ